MHVRRRPLQGLFPVYAFGLDAQLRNLKSMKASGTDDICAEQLQHLGLGAKTTLLQL